MLRHLKIKKEKYLCVGACLHWILVYVERINISEQDRGMIKLFLKEKMIETCEK